MPAHLCLRLAVILPLSAILFPVPAAPAQDAAFEQNKLLARRAAEADALRKLAEAVYGIQLNSCTFVKDFVTESDEIRSAVDTFVKGVRLAEPMWFEDGSCEVEAEVTVEKAVEALRGAYDRHYDGDDVTAEDIEHVRRRVERGVIKAVGMGAPRPDLPPSLPEAARELLGPAPAGAPAHVPEIWRTLPPQARMMALRAAAEDAKRKLAERIVGLRLTSRTLVRDFAAEEDVIRTELSATIYPEEVERYLHSDELIAEVRVRMPTEQVITSIKKLHSRHYEGNDLEGHDVEDVVKRVVRKEFEATGMGVPPERYLRQYAAAPEHTLPEWALGTLEATGEATDPELGTPRGRLKAARAAEVVAKRNLAERIAGLELQPTVRIADLAAQGDLIWSMVDAAVVGATVVETRFADGTAVVRVAVPGLRVWELVNVRTRPAAP